MERARARDGKSPASSSTTGLKVVVARCGSRCRIACSKTRSAIGLRWVKSACWSRRCHGSARERPSGSRRACCSPPTPRCARRRSEEHTSELQSLMRISYAVFCLKKKKTNKKQQINIIKSKNTNEITEQVRERQQRTGIGISANKK